MWYSLREIGDLTYTWPNLTTIIVTALALECNYIRHYMKNNGQLLCGDEVGERKLFRPEYVKMFVNKVKVIRD